MNHCRASIVCLGGKGLLWEPEQSFIFAGFTLCHAQLLAELGSRACGRGYKRYIVHGRYCGRRWFTLFAV